jgi:hypothetical protein
MSGYTMTAPWVAVTPERRVLTYRSDPTPTTIPATEPRSTIANTRPVTSHATRNGLAPTATRIAISRRRWSTE